MEVILLLNTILISLGLLLFFIIVIFLIRKTFIGIIVLSIILISFYFFLSYYNINLKEFSYIINSYNNVSKVIDNINYDKENKEYLIGNKDYGIILKKDDEVFILKGEVSNLNKENVKNLFSLLEFSSQFIPIDEKSISNVNSPDISNDIINNSVNNLTDVINNPDLFLKKVEKLEKGTDNLDIGGFNFNINNENSLNVNLGDINKIVNDLKK